MDHFIDSFSKKLAPTMSRRSMLGIASKTIIGALFASTWADKLWGQTSATSECPSCGSWQRCDTKTGKCWLDHEFPCVTAVVCELAQLFQPYVTLQNFLQGQQFTGSEPEAVVVTNQDDTISIVLRTDYIGPLPNQTAKLMLTVGNVRIEHFFDQKHLLNRLKKDLNAYAAIFSDNSPQLGYYVSVNGQIQQVLLPYALQATTSPSSNTNVQTEVIEIDAASSIVQAKASPSPAATACKQGCGLLCGYVLSDICTNLAGANCIYTIEFGPEAPLLCFLLAASLCSVGSDPLCTSLCQNATCSCQPGSQSCGLMCCDICQQCSSDGLVCIPKQCPSGSSCSSTLGCVCDTELCGGSSCCPVGSTCQNGTCTTSTSCPTGTTSCGSTCCPAGAVCQNGTCSSGLQVTCESNLFALCQQESSLACGVMVIACGASPACVPGSYLYFCLQPSSDGTCDSGLGVETYLPSGCTVIG